MGKPSVKALRKRLSGRVADHPERFGREGPFDMSWSPFPQGRFWKFLETRRFPRPFQHAACINRLL
jgi:hypothetical protein